MFGPKCCDKRLRLNVWSDLESGDFLGWRCAECRRTWTAHFSLRMERLLEPLVSLMLRGNASNGAQS